MAPPGARAERPNASTTRPLESSLVRPPLPTFEHAVQMWTSLPSLLHRRTNQARHTNHPSRRTAGGQLLEDQFNKDQTNHAGYVGTGSAFDSNKMVKVKVTANSSPSRAKPKAKIKMKTNTSPPLLNFVDSKANLIIVIEVDKKLHVKKGHQSVQIASNNATIIFSTIDYTPALTGHGNLYHFQVRLMKFDLVVCFDKLVEDKFRGGKGNSITRGTRMEQPVSLDIIKRGVIDECHRVARRRSRGEDLGKQEPDQPDAGQGTQLPARQWRKLALMRAG
ncbi:hypothetical protein CONLIGDRAFT_718708 [Coniochaeta ligniaria NRRL 30616]|uniref:Uncharacterized protein n=1 Tax=Coniochaeta ligniaria NRRL 30616 TaxID=1408157 RepID=A0A1J7IA40_9PEZI|nr:hypothetical protein CONLIGDRAFT_718708 [Coniochaeta ligniaria NRRL 30616]